MLSAPSLLSFDIPDEGGKSSHKLFCYEWGNPHASKTLLCVHGLTRNGRDFDFLAQAMAGEYRVLCPDMPGRGKSPWLADPKAYTNPAYLQDLLFILKSLGIKQVHWLGTSMGGILAMLAASAAPGLITTLTLNDIGCVIPATGLRRIMDIADIQTVFDTRAEAEAAFRKRTESFGLRNEQHWRHLQHYAIEGIGGKWRFTYDPAIFASAPAKGKTLEDVNMWPLFEAMKKLPILLIRGAQSDILTHETALEMRALHPALTLHEIADCGHAPALMEDKQIALVRGWMSAVKSQ